MALLVLPVAAGGAGRALAGAEPPPGYDPGPEPSIDDFCRLIGCDFFRVQQVAIDIEPGNDNNCFVNDGHGIIRVAILGSATFDATQVIVSSVSLSSMPVHAAGNGSPLSQAVDVNGDGFTDLIVAIEDQDGVFASGASWATLHGFLNNGTEFIGDDEVCVL